MAVAKSFRVMFMLVAATVALSACAKKDSEFKGRKNASGAKYAGDPAQNAAADAAAAALGITSLDIIKTDDPVLVAQGKVRIHSEVEINKELYDISLDHTSINQPATVSGQVGPLTLTATGICITQNCSPYYLMLNFSRGNQEAKQMVLKKFFFYGGPATEDDYIIQRAGGKFETLQSAINILNQGAVEDSEE